MKSHPTFRVLVGRDGAIHGPRGLRKVRYDKDGYARLNVVHEGERKTLKVHTLVAETYIGPTTGLVVNHKDGVKTNNTVENLEIIQAGENTKHAWDTGLIAAPCAPVMGFRSKREAERQTGVPRWKL